MSNLPICNLCLYQVAFADVESPLLYVCPKHIGDDVIFRRIAELNPDRKVKSIIFAAEGVFLGGTIVDFE